MLPRLALRHAERTGGDAHTALVRALTILLDGRRRGATDALAAGIIDEIAPADALSCALGIARRIATQKSSEPIWSPVTQTSTIAMPDVESSEDVQRLLTHHDRIPRAEPARVIIEVVRLGLSRGVTEGLAAEAAAFGRLVTSSDGRAGLDRFLARRSFPLPLRRV
jgi:3-hydroxyacyl-CoA dehydrogenase/enoyl-CoA hydratase/3-hydroxybutyryl-CoA epimerase